MNYLLQYYLKLSLGLVVFSCLVSVSVSGGVGEMGLLILPLLLVLLVERCRMGWC